MQGCALGDTTVVRRDETYDIRCQHDVNTQNVTWTFTSSVDQSTSVLVQCMVYSRNPDVHCRSLLPYFNIARPDFMYTTLMVGVQQMIIAVKFILTPIFLMIKRICSVQCSVESTAHRLYYKKCKNVLNL
jgi:hypothetical protein